MKKILFLFLVLLFYYFVSRNIVNSFKIPSDSIRIRIIPNSNSSLDQGIKEKVKDKLEITLYDLLKDTSDSSEARKKINDNLDLVHNDISSVFSSNNYNLDYDVNYGFNYFPEKMYKGVKYDSGYYESLLVTIGKGEGDNYWCVLFPPLCLIESDNNVEYRSLISEILQKYVH